MHKAFQRRLFVILFSVFIVTFGVSYLLQTHQAEHYATDAMKLSLEYLKKQVDFADRNRKVLKQNMGEVFLEKAKTLALNLDRNTHFLKEERHLNDWRTDNSLYEIIVLNKKGDVIGHSPKQLKVPNLMAYPQYRKMVHAQEKMSLFEEYCNTMETGPSEDNMLVLTIIPNLPKIGMIQLKRLCEIDYPTIKTASIKNLAANFKIDKSGFAMIATGGKIISTGDKDVTEKEIMYSGLLEHMFEEDDYNKRREGTFWGTLNGKKVLFYYVPYKEYTLIAVYPEKDMYRHRNVALRWGTLFYLLLYAITYLLLSILLERIVISGIKKTNKSLEKITAGDLTEEVNVRTNEEFISLSDGINSTVRALKEAIEKEKSRMDLELKFAHEIQDSAIPKTFPAFPEKNQFDLFALMRPAKEVSGDFYDFGLVGEDNSRLGFIIADVSGKGVPAALFMMSVKTLIKNLAEAGLSAAEIFTKANRQLCEHNETSMFVTAFMGLLDIDTGILTYTNAGHNPPYLRRADGEFEQLKVDPAFALAGLSETVFTEKQLQMNFGDTLFLYTDGITEGQNKDEEFYGEDRLKKALDKNKDLSVTNLLLTVRADIAEFEKGVEQADDITMVGLMYTAQRIEVPAKIEQTEIILDFLDGLLTPFNSGHKTQIEIAAEEVFVNIANYAYPPEDDGSVSVVCAIGGSPRFISVSFIDSGIPFNPLNKPDPDVTLSLDEREEGNLGIFMVKKLMDSAEYTYKNNQNVFTFYKKL